MAVIVWRRGRGGQYPLAASDQNLTETSLSKKEGLLGGYRGAQQTKGSNAGRQAGAWGTGMSLQPQDPRFCLDSPFSLWQTGFL